ncbi:hypothetical protein DFR58_14315 [Anaerobacterium chartisolvens]|uniref:Uncharacterized protein n=1 Tax=Anaerobacterium chartisolvens TaxID=1297424 RepID=A0A369AGN8_9FIRM|nr:hypothetical protein [Anaerobacterium chartisolvens]RCX08303.1 hypothetical protein DFR58_14315 [Anaerobacterium chartisolvens]
MVNVLNLHSLLNGNYMKTNLSLGNCLIFIEQNDYLSNSGEPIQYIGIKKLNTLTHSVSSYAFNYPADIISHVSACATLYYSSVFKQESNYFISLNKFNCMEWNEENVITISLEINDTDTPLFIKDSVIIGLDDRYCIMAIPNFLPKYGQPFFGNLLLIDSLEKKKYSITEKVGNLDSLHCMDEAWTCKSNDGSLNLLIKTGRIRPFEKKRFWDDMEKYGENAEYFDQFEKLILYKVDNLINDVKYGATINKIILCDCNFKGALSVVSVDNRKIIYSVQLFKQIATEIISYDLETTQTKTVKDKLLYDYVIYSNKKLFGFKQQGKATHVFNIEDKRNMFISHEHIIYIDEEKFITLKRKPHDFKRLIVIYNMSSADMLEAIECSFFDYNTLNNTLTIY